VKSAFFVSQAPTMISDLLPASGRTAEGQVVKRRAIQTLVQAD